MCTGYKEIWGNMSSQPLLQEDKLIIDDLLHAVNGLIEMANGELITMDETVNVSDEPGTSDIDLTELETMGFYESQLQEVELGIRQRLPVQLYAQTCYNWMQMKEIRLGLLADVDVKWYTNPLYHAEQMHQIRLGLEYGLDVSGYAKLIYTVSDMYKKRHALMEDRYRSGGMAQEQHILDEYTGIRLRIAGDLMKAWITLPADRERSYTVAELRRLLKKHEVCHGFVDEGLQQAAIEGVREKELLIASGTPAMPGKDGYYQLYFNRQLPDSPRVLPDGSVDYTQVTVADTALPGQQLAKYQPPGRGKAGMTVTGLTVDGAMGRELPPLTGKGITADEKQRIYSAAIKGYVTYDEEAGKLNVLQTYLVNGDVNRYSGSVIYDGSIQIKGSVNEKAVIRATGDVIVDGFVSGGTIEAGNNVILRGGVNAADQGYIRAENMIMGNFFERVKLSAGGNIEGNYFLDCHVESDGRVIAKGGKSRIMGGEVTASAGVEAAIIGNYGSTRTVVSTANLYELTERLEALKEQQKKVCYEQEKLAEGKDKLRSLLGDEAAAANRIYQKTLLAIEVKQQEWEDLGQKLEHLKLVKQIAMQGNVKVTRELRPGAVIVINGVTKVVVDTMSGTTLTEESLLKLKQ